jgi:hypothetical protein
LLVLISWADTLGESGGGWDLDDMNTHIFQPEEACLACGLFFGLFLAVQLPLTVARYAWRWRVSRPLAPSRTSRQFSLRQVFGWTTLVAVLLAGSRYLLRHQEWGGFPDPPWMPLLRQLGFYVSFMTYALIPILLPVIPITALVLGQRRRIAFLIATIVCAAIAALASVALIADQNASVRLQDGFFEEVGFCGVTLLALWVVRACGFRLAPFDNSTT